MLKTLFPTAPSLLLVLLYYLMGAVFISLFVKTISSSEEPSRRKGIAVVGYVSAFSVALVAFFGLPHYWSTTSLGLKIALQVAVSAFIFIGALVSVAQGCSRAQSIGVGVLLLVISPVVWAIFDCWALGDCL